MLRLEDHWGTQPDIDAETWNTREKGQNPQIPPKELEEISTSQDDSDKDPFGEENPLYTRERVLRGISEELEEHELNPEKVSELSEDQKQARLKIQGCFLQDALKDPFIMKDIKEALHYLKHENELLFLPPGMFVNILNALGY